MGFASAYLSANTITDVIFPEKPAEDTGIIVVIPAFDEPGIIFTLQSLDSCKKPPCAVEVMVIVNAPAGANEKQIRQNDLTCKALSEWKRAGKNNVFDLLFYDAGIQEDAEWGVGMARKMGMDEALRRFNSINMPEGAIVSLDADCRVRKDYLEKLFSDFYLKNKLKACSLYFEHPLEGEHDPEIYDAIYQYELHLRYYYQALKYSGFHPVFHTIGSAIAVKAGAYARSGGMNRRQGGEDFYFIQKMVPAGGFFYLTTTTVYPSPRVSYRVPFGTGPVIGKMIHEPGSEYLTYNPQSFEYLRALLVNISGLYELSKDQEEEIFRELHESLQYFLDQNNWKQKLEEIRNNTSSPDSFEKRFFTWFNMFRIVKYLNFLHAGQYHMKMPVKQAAALMLSKMGYREPVIRQTDLLKMYRDIER